MTPATDLETDVFYSSLAGDPDLGEIVDLFVAEMPERVTRLAELLACGDWKELGRLAHQLKGACGSYGFDQLTPAASRLEIAAKEHRDEHLIRDLVAELTALCAKIRGGVAECPHDV